MRCTNCIGKMFILSFVASTSSLAISTKIPRFYLFNTISILPIRRVWHGNCAPYALILERIKFVCIVFSPKKPRNNGSDCTLQGSATRTNSLTLFRQPILKLSFLSVITFPEQVLRLSGQPSIGVAIGGVISCPK
jgi:hypothetical protein